jgi:hypothetical protein
VSFATVSPLWSFVISDRLKDMAEKAFAQPVKAEKKNVVQQ